MKGILYFVIDEAIYFYNEILPVNIIMHVVFQISTNRRKITENITPAVRFKECALEIKVCLKNQTKKLSIM